MESGLKIASLKKRQEQGSAEEKKQKNAIWILKVELKIVSLKKRKEISWKQPEKDNKIIIEIIIKSKKNMTTQELTQWETTPKVKPPMR